MEQRSSNVEQLEQRHSFVVPRGSTNYVGPKIELSIPDIKPPNQSHVFYSWSTSSSYPNPFKNFSIPPYSSHRESTFAPFHHLLVTFSEFQATHDRHGRSFPLKGWVSSRGSVVVKLLASQHELSHRCKISSPFFLDVTFIYYQIESALNFKTRLLIILMVNILGTVLSFLSLFSDNFKPTIKKKFNVPNVSWLQTCKQRIIHNQGFFLYILSQMKTW